MGDHFKILENLIRHTAIRHGVILSNIANSDTPNYKVRDVKFENELSSAMLELKITHFKHMKKAHSEVSGKVTIEPTKSWLDGNNVELDLEVAKLIENVLLFQAGINMLSAKIRMFKNALRR
jgi:flagellar basal-body rod protein FlgB